jgi:hypothetical protein
MRPISTLAVMALMVVLVLVPRPLPVHGADAGDKHKAIELEMKRKASVAKALKWIASKQQADGSWTEFDNQYPITMTAISGMALLMEGSTIRKGKYKDNIRKAVTFLKQQANHKNGMIGKPDTPGESGRYMFGHGFAMMFLASVYGKEEGEGRKELEQILVKAAQFSHDGQTRRKSWRNEKIDVGGWGYVSAREGHNFDEGSSTVTQVQALRAVRNAGITVPPNAIPMAVEYLKDSTNGEGGITYRLDQGARGQGEGKPALTAAAISCGFSAGEYKSEEVKKWFKFCQSRLGGVGRARFGHDEYSQYYYAQAVYILGDDGWGKLFPKDDKKDWVTWTRYKETAFTALFRSQDADGSWTGGHVGPKFITAFHACILQLDDAALPLYRR